MVSFGGTFDSSKVEPYSGYETVPPGIYKLRLVDASEKPNNKGTGTYINMQYEVIEPESYAGKKIFEKLNLKNPSETAVKISLAKLSALTRAVGLVTISDTDELLMKPFMAKVKVNPPKNGYDASNEIATYIHGNSEKPAASAPAIKSGAPSWATPK